MFNFNRHARDFGMIRKSKTIEGLFLMKEKNFICHKVFSMFTFLAQCKYGINCKIIVLYIKTKITISMKASFKQPIKIMSVFKYILVTRFVLNKS